VLNIGQREFIVNINYYFFRIRSVANEDPKMCPKIQRLDVALDQRQKQNIQSSRALQERVLKPLSKRSGHVEPQKKPQILKETHHEDYYRNKENKLFWYLSVNSTLENSSHTDRFSTIIIKSC